uniref:Uncharacterized protein n=1 Tax=Babesia bovis TaxID=5865 RepID=S6BNP4_BABBO|nr:conserved hypothetical protein [Babesia bovis]
MKSGSGTLDSSSGLPTKADDDTSVDPEGEPTCDIPPEPIYYLYEGDVQWWDDDPVAVTQPRDEWIDPPPRPRLNNRVNRLIGTHLVSPIKHGTHFDKGDDLIDPPEPAAKGNEEQPKRRVNIELRPVKQAESPTKPRKSLRERLRDGEVVFYEDFVEREITRDFCRLFQRPFPVPRHDWGGGDFFYGEHVPSVKDIGTEIPPAFDIENLSEATAEPVEAPVRNSHVDALIKADSSITPAHREELINGEIPSLYSTLPTGSVRQRHPKDRLVSYHHLRTYACMIDSVTKCPLIHVELKAALQQGWLPQREIAKLEPKSRTKEPPPDPYAVTPEQVERANEILASRRKPVVSQPRNMNIVASRRQGARKEPVQVGGGRYEV